MWSWQTILYVRLAVSLTIHVMHGRQRTFVFYLYHFFADLILSLHCRCPHLPPIGFQSVLYTEAGDRTIYSRWRIVCLRWIARNRKGHLPAVVGLTLGTDNQALSRSESDVRVVWRPGSALGRELLKGLWASVVRLDPFVCQMGSLCSPWLRGRVAGSSRFPFRNANGCVIRDALCARRTSCPEVQSELPAVPERSWKLQYFSMLRILSTNTKVSSCLFGQKRSDTVRKLMVLSWLV